MHIINTLRELMIYSGGLLAALFLSGCVSMPQNLLDGLRQDKFYKRDIGMTVDGVTYTGAMVLPRRAFYSIRLKAKGRLDLMTFETCHQAIIQEEAWKNSGIFDGRNVTVIEYNPVRDIEQGDLSCPVRIGGYEKKRGRHSWGLIEFQSKSLKMPAVVRCAGASRRTVGVAICQSKHGTIQEIEFKRPMFVAKKTKCIPMKCEGSCKKFRYTIPKGECIYRFKEDHKRGRSFRLVTIGYEGILIRED